MKNISVDDVMRFGPCDPYDRGRVEELFAGRERVSALDILGADIPARDRLWVVLHEELVPAQVLNEFAHWCEEGLLTTKAWVEARDAAVGAWGAWDAARSAQIAKLEEMLAAVERDGE